jgi:phosphate/sulfate permease
MLLTLIILVVLLALVFDYINGMHDTANAIATVVSTRVLSPRNAIIMAASLNFVGALWSESVAKTIGKGIIDPTAITQLTVMAALIGAIAWNLITWYYGIPSSSSHALIGGVIGAAIATIGPGKLHSDGIIKVVKGLIFSPIIGAGIAFLIMIAILWAFRNVPPGKSNRWFKGMQMVSASIMAFSHGMGDAQKSMGIIVMAMVAYTTASHIALGLHARADVGQAFLCGGDGLWDRFGRLAHHQNAWAQDDQVATGPRVRCRSCRLHRDSDRIELGCAGFHDPFHFGCDHGRWHDASIEFGALGCRQPNGVRLGVDHSRNRAHRLLRREVARHDFPGDLISKRFDL